MVKKRRGVIPLLRKGGAHRKSRSSERQKQKKALRKEVFESGRDDQRHGG